MDAAAQTSPSASGAVAVAKKIKKSAKRGGAEMRLARGAGEIALPELVPRSRLRAAMLALMGKRGRIGRGAISTAQRRLLEILCAIVDASIVGLDLEGTAPAPAAAAAENAAASAAAAAAKRRGRRTIESRDIDAAVSFFYRNPIALATAMRREDLEAAVEDIARSVDARCAAGEAASASAV